MPDAASTVQPGVAAALLGTAIGDALGVPFEGATRRYMRRRRPSGDWTHYHGFWGRGLVSDDTQQAVLVATALTEHPFDPDSAVATYKRLLLRWFVALPFGAGGATLRACVRTLTGRVDTGIRSAGNGAVMRSAVIGAAYPDDQEARHAMTIALSQVTHTHPDAIAGALIGADLTAHASASDTGESTHAVALRTLQALDNDASQSILEWATHWRTDNASSPRSLRTRCYLALDLANRADVTADDAVRALGSSGWTNHTVPLALYWFSCVGDPERALTAAVRSGGDTDTVAAIVGAWSVSKFGVEAVPPSLLRDLQDGTYGRQHLTNLADSLDASINGDRDAVAPRISFGRSAGRNVVTLPNLVFYAFRAVFIRR